MRISSVTLSFIAFSINSTKDVILVYTAAALSSLQPIGLLLTTPITVLSSITSGLPLSP